MQENTKSVVVKMTARRCFRTEPIWQYDGGHVLTFEGFDLPMSFEVHFSRSPVGKAIPQIGIDGVCTVPEMFTQDAGVIYAWLYIVDADSRLTKYSIEIPVAKRAKPTNQEPTPVEQSAIDQAIAALNAGVEAAEDAQEAAESAQEAAEGYAESAGNSAITATNAANAAGSAQTAAEAAARNAAASATDANASRQAADQSATNAGVSERNAAASASAAAGSATSAATAAGQASASATAASGSASTASEKASEAAQSATAAAGSAASASENAGTASTAATAAGQSATAAAGSATAAAGSATSAGQSATAAAGSAQTAQDVLDSIPADYSELSEDVNSLKSAINDIANPYLKLIAEPSSLAESGSIQSDSGGVQPVSTWVHTDYIDISGADKIVVVMPTFSSSNKSGLAFYDSNKTNISGKGVAGRNTGTNSYEVRTLTVPDNAKYVRTSIRVADMAQFYLKIDNVADVISRSENTANMIKPYLATIAGANSFLYDGTIYAPTGEESSTGSSSWKYTDYIDIEGINSFIATVPTFASANNAGFAFYYSDKSYAGGVYGKVTTNASFEKRTLYVPENAKYIRFCFRNTEQPYFYAYVNAFDNIFQNEKANAFGIQMFEKIGVIGDSISVGWAKDKNGNNSRRNTGISWVQQMARWLGCTAYNLGASGVDPIEWFQPNYEFAEYCYTQYQSVGICDLYIIGLGLNQGTLGSISDINQSDYTQNAETFYGQYARIIQMINAEHPSAKVICLTEPTTAISSYDNAVRTICALNYIDAELLDLEADYFDLFNTPEILAEHQPDNLHFTPYGYSLLAKAMVTALNDYISKNPSHFKYVGVQNV